MAFDGVFLYGLAKELEDALRGGRVDRIQQPEADEIHITVRNKGGNHKLLLSASANHPRIHLTRQSKINPFTPPMFCMALRKHLSGARLSFIKQLGMDRILKIGFASINELGDSSEKFLVIEIMGRHSNIILIDSDDLILAAIKHVNQNISRVREVLPGRSYTYPPSQNKIDPLAAQALDVEEVLLSSKPGSSPVDLLTKVYTGISRVTSEEICYRGNGETSKIAEAFRQFFQQVRDNQLQPTLLMDDAGKPLDVFPMQYTMYHLDRLKFCTSFSEALEEFFSMRDKAERIQQRTAHLHRVIKNNVARCRKKIELQNKELEKAKDAKQYRLFGELIISNIHQISTGTKQVTLLNFYSSDNSMITIPLDPAKTPAQNAQNYFKMYNKYRRVQETHSRFIKETREELEYLESITQYLSICTDENDITEIQEELVQEGYLKTRARVKKKRPLTTSKPHRFLSSDGFEIYVGKNNLQNDRLTFKIAMPGDLWLHTKAIQGSHVIVKTEGKTIPNTTLLEAANLAAYYSNGRCSANVPVDYCIRKNVRKPKGAKPGMVIYEQYKTIFVTPSEEMMLSMRKL
jgi:predicted ribosome quality control (RQC) complex YloA/Tae2 family protein